MDRKGFCGGALFAGANSGRGFVSFYGELFERDEIERIYILKGGPGTGKSSFMKRAAAFSEDRGYGVERYYCSSDPSSLDAVLIDGRIVILDGTAPHVMEANVAGARDEIINLGAFWNADALADQRERITELSLGKKVSYERAYSYLGAYKNVKDINSRLIFGHFREDKAKRAVDRIFSDIKTGGGARTRVGLVNSLGMKGRYRYDTYESFADRVFAIDDHFDTAHLFLRLLATRAELTDTPIRISYDPLDTDRPDAIFFENDKTAFVISSEEADNFYSRINMKRFLSPIESGVKKEFRSNVRLCEALIGSASECLSRAGKYHFELEDIYVRCMDFEALEDFVGNFLQTRLNFD